MKRKFQTVTALSVFGALMGCAQMTPSGSPGPAVAARGQQDKLPVKVAPGQATLAGTSGADVLFSVGRYAHAAGQLDQATQRYGQALELNPDHIGALNAMAVIHAQAGRTDEALTLFTRAVALAPKAAHVHNNMGYTLLRAGKLGEAREKLQLARQLDPGNVQTTQNLELLAQEEVRSPRTTLAVNSKEPAAPVADERGPRLVAVAPSVYELRHGATGSETAQAAARPAPAQAPLQVVQQADTRVVVVTQVPAPAAPVVMAQTPTVQTSAQPVASAQTMAAVQPIVNAPVADAKPAAPRSAPTLVQAPVVIAVKAERPAAAPVQPAAPQPFVDALRGVKLEVSNGVGITNLARRTADRLAPTGVITARLTNARPFRQAKTEIQFVAGQNLSAQALQARLPVTAKTVTAKSLERGVQIRLVLGHDVAGRAIAAWLDAEEQRLAESTQVGGWVLV